MRRTAGLKKTLPFDNGVNRLDQIGFGRVLEQIGRAPAFSDRIT
jgi:hypothetical protein